MVLGEINYLHGCLDCSRVIDVDLPKFLLGNNLSMYRCLKFGGRLNRTKEKLMTQSFGKPVIATIDGVNFIDREAIKAPPGLEDGDGYRVASTVVGEVKGFALLARPAICAKTNAYGKYRQDFPWVFIGLNGIVIRFSSSELLRVYLEQHMCFLISPIAYEAVHGRSK